MVNRREREISILKFSQNFLGFRLWDSWLGVTSVQTPSDGLKILWALTYLNKTIETELDFRSIRLVLKKLKFFYQLCNISYAYIVNALLNRCSEIGLSMRCVIESVIKSVSYIDSVIQ